MGCSDSKEAVSGAAKPQAKPKASLAPTTRPAAATSPTPAKPDANGKPRPRSGSRDNGDKAKQNINKAQLNASGKEVQGNVTKMLGHVTKLDATTKDGAEKSANSQDQWLDFEPAMHNIGDDWEVVNAETLTPWFRGERKAGKRRATHVDWEAPPQPNPELTQQVAANQIGAVDYDKAERLAQHHPPVGWNLVRTEGEKYLYVVEGGDTGSNEHPFVAHYKKLIYEEKSGAQDKALDATLDATTKSAQPPTLRTFITPVGLPVAEKGPEAASADWNERFQSIWDKNPVTAPGLAAREKELDALFKDFHKAATRAAIHFVHDVGTGKRNQVKRVGNLLLSFQNSASNIKRFGTRSLACKMFHHEHVGFETVLAANLKTLHVPLTCTVKYLGHRVSVSAVMPLSSNSQVLGPNDTSLSAHKRTYKGVATDAEKYLACVAQDFRLAPHKCSLQNHPTIAAGSAFNEVHQGTDGRLYATQVSRMLPICPAYHVDPNKFRPELVKAYRVGEGISHYLGMDHKEIEVEMQKYVNQDSALFFTEWLTSENGMKTVGELDELSNVFHHFGVSMSRLHNVYLFIKMDEELDIEIKALRVHQLRTEMFARALKEAIRHASDISSVFERFMDDPVGQLTAVVFKKFGWNPLAEGLTNEDVNKQHVLYRVSVMLKSNIKTDEDPEGQVVITEVSLNQDELARKRIKKTARPFFYAHTMAHKRFRPEILRSLNAEDPAAHLSSDSFTKESSEEDFQRDVGCVDSLLYKVLIRKVVPEFASDILRFPPDTQEMLCTLAHQHGINIRLLANVLFHLNQWKNDGDTFTVKDKANGNPVALNMVLIELQARTLASWVEDHNMGQTYTAACENTKAAYQRILDDPMWLSKETAQKYDLVEAAGGDIIVPANKVFQRASALCGALVVMSSPYEVEEVMFMAVVKGYTMPAHLKANWLIDAQVHEVNPALLPPLEYQLQERSDRRADLGEAQVPNLALLSVLYENWNKVEMDARADHLGDVRRKLVDIIPEDSPNAADANYMLGMYYYDHHKVDRALPPLKRAYEHEVEAGKITENGFNAALTIGNHLNKNEDAGALEWFEKALKAGPNCDGVSEEKVLLDVQLPLAELLLAEGEGEEDEGRKKQLYNLVGVQLGPVVTYLEKTIDKLKRHNRKADKERLNELGQALAKALETRARARYSLNEFTGSIKDFEEALAVYKEYMGVTSDMADIAVCLGQIYHFQEKFETSRENFEVAVSIYGATQGPDEVSVKIILEDHLGPLYQKMGHMSQYHKCRLQLLLDGSTDFNQTPTDAVAMKFFAIAVAYEGEKDDEGAIRYFQLSLMAHKQVYGDDHRHTAKCREWLEHLGGKATWPAVRQMSPRGSSRRPAFAAKSDNLARSHGGVPTTGSFRSTNFDRSFKSQNSRRMLSGIPTLASEKKGEENDDADENDFNREPQTVRSMLCRGGLGTFRNIQFADTESVADCESEGTSSSEGR
eukprot:TRINITY_DN12117_c0_g2_i1.p1 TRINITY_DN12117_c0_g2~~TRINITY_DN12117_c0_g2_i1.p1  ORF type:complete len:1474 (+),score=621.61 TRINITY_DN12117_c0_g2_i1:61-4482(+)